MSAAAKALAAIALGIAACAPSPQPGEDGGRDGSVERRDGGPPRCAARGPERDLAACSDGCDNEAPAGDGYADCDDFDCCDARLDCPASSACGRRGRRDAGPTCARGPESDPVACRDGCSNDGDPYVDCDDFDCCDHVACGPRTACGRR